MSIDQENKDQALDRRATLLTAQTAHHPTGDPNPKPVVSANPMPKKVHQAMPATVPMNSLILTILLRTKKTIQI